MNTPLTRLLQTFTGSLLLWVALSPAMAAESPRQTTLFDAGWRFHLGDVPEASKPGFDDRAWRSLDLPHDWSIEGPFDAKWASGTGYLPGGIGWYRKAFRLPTSASDKRISIRFDGIYMNSEVWLNGHSLGRRPYGYITFEYDLTPFLRPAPETNVLAVRVDHSAFADSRWYNGSGIYRHVWMITTSDLHVAPWGIFVTTPEVNLSPSGRAATIAIQTRIKNESPAAREAVLTSTIEDRSGKAMVSLATTRPVAEGEEARFEQNMRLANPALWSPDTPNLYTLVSRVKVANAVVDEVRTPFGVRSYFFDANKGFLLNGAKTLLKGVCIHHDAGCLGAAVPNRALERRLQLLKELGCNAIRTSHNPPAPELLDMCDRMGFMVMDEAFDEWARPKKKWVLGRNNGTPSYDGYAKYFDEWGVKDLQSMVERDKNHPSIILWSIGNEIDYNRDPYYDPTASDYTPEKPSAAELVGLARTLAKAVTEIDTTRPVTAALATIQVSDRTGLPDTLDVVGYNYQEKFYTQDHERYPARKLVGSENSHAYNVWTIVEDLPYANGQFLWTGIDYIGEAGAWPVRGSSAGLLDECGFKKPGYYFRQSLWSDKPMVYLAVRPPTGGGRGGRGGGFQVSPSWTWPSANSNEVNVVCYANCEKVELFLNGKSLGEKPLTTAQDRVLTWRVPYSPGTLKAVGKNGRATICTCELNTAGKAAHIKLAPDVKQIAADGRDLVHVEVSVTDNEGNLIYAADNQLHFALTGPGRMIGVDSGDQRSHEDFKANTRKAYHGQCLVIVQSTAATGNIALTASADGLRSETLAIRSAAPRSAGR